MHHNYESDCTKFQLYGKTLHLDCQNVFRIWFDKNFVWLITAIALEVCLWFSQKKIRVVLLDGKMAWLLTFISIVCSNICFEYLKVFIVDCQVITIIYQQRALFTWNSMCFKYALCFTLDINNQTTFHHKRKSIRISLVKGLCSQSI